MPNTDFIEIGPAQVLWGPVGAEVDVGWTLGGVTFAFSDTYADKKVDQHGATVLDKINAGSEVSTSVPLTELTHANLARITGEIEEVEDGGAGPGRRVRVHSRTGCSLLAGAQNLILKPRVCGVPTDNRNKWFTAPLANWEATIEDTFDPEGQRIWQSALHIFPDPSQNMLFFTYGDTLFT